MGLHREWTTLCMRSPSSLNQLCMSRPLLFIEFAPAPEALNSCSLCLQEVGKGVAQLRQLLPPRANGASSGMGFGEFVAGWLFK